MKEELNLESELSLDNGCLVWTFPKCALPQQPVDLHFKALRIGVFKIASKKFAHMTTITDLKLILIHTCLKIDRYLLS